MNVLFFTMEPQKTLNSQSDPKKKQAWNIIFLIQIMLQRYSKKMVW